MPDPGLAPDPQQTDGQREINLMRAAGMDPGRMHDEVQNEINLQRAAGMKEPDIQKYWGIQQPQSPTVARVAQGNVAHLLSAPPAVAARIQQAVQQATQADQDVRDASDIGGNPDERPDTISQILGYGKAVMEYGSAAWTYATAWPVGMVDQGPGRALSDAGILASPHVLGDAVSQTAALATMKPVESAMSLPARQAAMEAFRKGEIGDPAHFPDAVVGRENVTPGMRNAVPSNADYQQAATRLLARPDAPAHPTMARRVMANMQRIWVETGLTPEEQLALSQSKPELKEELLTQDVHGDPVTPSFSRIRKPEPKPLAQPSEAGAAESAATPRGVKPPPALPTFSNSIDESMAMMRSLEGSPDIAGRPQVSRTGAVGRFQIEPSTARQYGLDPDRLSDPEYNEQAARVIITDLYNKYRGNMEAMAIAYNDGPKRANEWLTSGQGTRLEAVIDRSVRGGWRYVKVAAARDESFLPAETQQYVARARFKMGKGGEPAIEGEGGPLGPDDFTAPPHAEVPADVDVRRAEAEEDTELRDRAQAQADEQRERIVSGGISAQSVWEHATDEQLLDEIGSSIGVPAETEVRGLSLYDRAITAVMSRLQPAKAVDDLAKQTMENYDPEKEFSLLDAFRQAAHSDDRAKVAMGFNWGGRERGGILVRDGDRGVKVLPNSATARAAFQQAIEDGGTPDDFMKWLVARRAAALDAAGTDTPVNVLAAQAAMRSKTLAAKYAKASQLWDQFTQGVRDYAQASGRYSQAQINAMKAADLGTWVSFNRIMGKEVGLTRRGFTVGAPVKGMKGSSEGMIGDPLSNSLDNVSAMFRAADNNYAIGKLVAMAEANPDLAALLGVRKVRISRDPNIDAVEKEMKAYGIPEDKWEAARDGIATLLQDREQLAGNQFAFYRDGQKEVWQTGWPELADMIKGATPVQAEGILKVAQSIGHAVSGAITAMPDFALKMFASHQLVQAINSPLHELPAATGLTGLAKLMGMDGMLEDVMANGGLGSSMRELDRDNHYDTMTQVLGETGWLDRVRNDIGQFKQEPSLAAAKKAGATAVLTPFRMLRAINERLDLGNRVGLSQAAQRAGMERLKAGAHAAEYGIDYTNRGASAVVNMWASMVPFMRAGLLYSEQGLKAIERNPAAYATSAAIAVSLPKMLLYGLNALQDEIPPGQPGYLPENEKYRNQPAWERLYYFITPSIDGQRFKLRMPDFAAYVFGALPEAAMMAMHEHNGPQFLDYLTTFLHDFIPPTTPAAVQAPLEALTNTNLETWQPLVPSSLTGVAGQLRYIQETSGPAQALAKFLGPDNAPLIGIGKIPPMAVIDHITRSWSGPAGAALLGTLGVQEGRPGQPMDTAKLPFVNSFLLTHTEGGRALNDFYAEKDRFDQWAQGRSELRLEQRRGEDANAGFTQETQRMAQADYRVRQASAAIGRMRDALYGIDANKEMSDDEKRQRTNQILNDQMIPEALAATEAMRRAMGKDDTLQMQEVLHRGPAS